MRNHTDTNPLMRTSIAQQYLQTIRHEQVLTQLFLAEGRMAELARDQGEVRLGWVNAVGQLLHHPLVLDTLAKEAHAIWQRGIRHVIWTSSAGASLPVRALRELGCCDGRAGGIALYPLERTDPAALQSTLRQIAAAKGLSLPSGPLLEASLLHSLLEDVLLIAATMHKTAEGPLMHLSHFGDLIERAKLISDQHLSIVTQKNTRLDHYACEFLLPSSPVELVGSDTMVSLMNAPATRLFLLPIALGGSQQEATTRARLFALLHQAWQWYNLTGAMVTPEQHPFVQLAVALAATAHTQGACRLSLDLPGRWHILHDWITHLLEHLGHAEAGMLVVSPDAVADLSCLPVLRVSVRTHATERQTPGVFVLHQPYLIEGREDDRLAALTASFLGWQLTMALYAYLYQIPLGQRKGTTR